MMREGLRGDSTGLMHRAVLMLLVLACSPQGLFPSYHLPKTLRRASNAR
jgi:hypothetical protein